MNNKKLSLENLKIASFITSTSDQFAETIKGGIRTTTFCSKNRDCKTELGGSACDDPYTMHKKCNNIDDGIV